MKRIIQHICVVESVQRDCVCASHHSRRHETKIQTPCKSSEATHFLPVGVLHQRQLQLRLLQLLQLVLHTIQFFVNLIQLPQQLAALRGNRQQRVCE